MPEATKEWVVTDPSGKEFVVTAPAIANEDQVMAYAKQKFAHTPAVIPPEEPRPGGFGPAMTQALGAARAGAEASTVGFGPAGHKVPLNLDPIGSTLGYLFSPLTAAGTVAGEKTTDVLRGTPLEGTPSDFLSGAVAAGTSLLGGALTGKAGQLVRQGAQKLAPHLPGASVGIRERGAQQIEQIPASLAPPVKSQDLYKAVEQVNPTVSTPGLKKLAKELSDKEDELSKYGLSDPSIKKIADQIKDAPDQAPFALIQSVRQRIGERIGELRRAGGEGLGAFKRMFRSLSDDLDEIANQSPNNEASQAFNLLKQANAAAKREFAVGELEEIFTASIGKAKEGAQFNSSNFAQALNKVQKLAKDDPLFAKGIGQEGLERVTKTLDDLRKIPVLPPPKGVNVGSALVNRQIGVGGGIGAAVGGMVGGPGGAGIGAGIGTAAGAFVPWAVSRMLQTDKGAQLLIRFMESPGGLMTPQKIAAMAAFVRGSTGENFPGQ